MALSAPFDVVLSQRTVFATDVLLARRADLTSRNLPTAPVLAIEVLSPSTRSIDRVLKYSRYAEAGVAYYWIVDPDEPSLTAYRLRPDGAYEQVAHVTNDDPYEATEPIGVVVVPVLSLPAEPTVGSRGLGVVDPWRRATLTAHSSRTR